ncbi:MAG: hypothetical protein US57_C0005G0017 [Candidatus Moranbacteria bacterium GW2011_GWC2_37_73]|nr:MAG: hypothetical protein UR95_C0001G0124 [Parcubacteria group bacterium GW2011_GWC1_36_108]KKQ01203.1 MAG: hypothetical protein US09_C0002G0041 [Candidatus Moranbacteria bacterium GW2011_GWD1_36_198]KKQ40061.1 MAG: hypothetical protein US57_C0005G0017 [Candidatus Moranbacteria bacterium GW2011_GWC2_37_73]HAR99532.1 hypothetical protein [Candidatus Moranbacteria bacterium]HBI50326.1 hypothetical protein [Candidatus Moranbacteria bacterium]
METFLLTIASNFPMPAWLVSVAFVVWAVYIIVGIAIRIFRFVDKTNSTMCLFDDVKKDIKSLDKKHTKLLEKFNTLIAALAEKNTLDNPDLFSTNSPVNLTPDGIAFIEKVGWKASIDNEDNRKSLFETLDKFKLQTKYDVEKYSIVLLTELAGMRENNPYTPVKRFLYENAKLDDFKVITACAIYLRDKYLESHLEIKE